MDSYFVFLIGFGAGLLAGFITAQRQMDKINKDSDGRIVNILEKES